MQNAFQTLKARTEESGEKAHRVAVTSAAVENGQLVIALPLASIAQSRPSKGEKGALGFMFEPVEFEVEGARFRINPGWTTLTAR